MPTLTWLTREHDLKTLRNAPYQLLEELPELSAIRQMIMYGSRARGGAREDSDLDLVALVDEASPELE